MFRTLMMSAAVGAALTATPADARYIVDKGMQFQQILLCHYVSDAIGDSAKAHRFLQHADYKAITAGWSPMDLAFYKGVVWARNEQKLKASVSELRKMYTNLACDVVLRMPIVTRDLP